MTTDLAKISSDRLHSMFNAGMKVLNCHRVLSKTDDNIVGELLKGHETFFQWDHYPPGDVYDREHDSQFYYHAHPQEERVGEHGHFHTFLHPEAFSGDLAPLVEPPEGELEEDEDALAHIVGISMDETGIPIRLFTVNRWVTGEVLYPAGALIGLLDRFNIDLAQPSWPVNLWLSNMIRLFRPEIETLLIARDKTVAKWQKNNPALDAYEDESLEVTSSIDISVDRQMEKLQKQFLVRGQRVPEPA